LYTQVAGGGLRLFPVFILGQQSCVPGLPGTL